MEAQNKWFEIDQSEDLKYFIKKKLWSEIWAYTGM